MTSDFHGNKTKREYTKNLTTMKAAVKELGDRGAHVIDRRTNFGKALLEWEHRLIEDLGGVDEVTTAQKAVIDTAMRTRLILDSIDAWILKQKNLVNRRHACLGRSFLSYIPRSFAERYRPTPAGD